jgi:uncharacterized spore protein YtfJ
MEESPEESPVPTELPTSEPPLAPGEATAVITPGVHDVIRRFIDGVRDTFTVRTVYGDPVESKGVTVIPVAQTFVGFGAGGGGGRTGGTGGGGGGVVRPIGFIEITAKGARWVPISRAWLRIAVRVLPPVIALLASRALRRRRKPEPKEG